MKKRLTFAFIGSLLALASCGGSQDWTYSSRSYENEDWELIANKPTKQLNSDFAWGIDVSSLKEVEKGGGKFYDRSGKERDVFEILAEGGSNYARFRLWNNPFDGNGKRYGGGTNDLATDIELAKRAQAAGMQVLIDFHYSDSWVDPGKCWAPKAWQNLTEFEEKTGALADFTKESLEAFKKEGITVNAVQIGNEINPGIAGVSAANYQRISAIIASGINASRVVFPKVKTIVHYTNVSTQQSQISKWVGYLQKYEALPDVIGFSYYPFWHGSLDNLQTVLNNIATTYGTEVMIVETSWGFTDEAAGDRGANNQFSSATLGEAGGYETSAQAQATVISDIVNVLSNVPEQKGTGIFYWEPAWLPNFSSGWITPEGAYYNDHGKDWIGRVSASDLEADYGGSYCYSSWANQAWFDYDGKVLPSAYTYRHLISGDHLAEESYQRLFKDNIDVIANLNAESWDMPSTVRVVTNLGAYRDVPVTWDQSQVDAITEPGVYEVSGVCAGFDVKATVKGMKNFVADPDFQLQGCKTESAVVDPWQITTTKDYKSDIGDGHIEAKSELGGSGNQYFHWYSNRDFSFDLHQDLGTLPAGKYDFGFTMLSEWYEDRVTSSKMYFTIDGEKTEQNIRTEHLGYGSGAHEVFFEGDIELIEESTVTIGFTLEGGNGHWGHADDFYFSTSLD